MEATIGKKIFSFINAIFGLAVYFSPAVLFFI